MKNRNVQTRNRGSFSLLELMLVLAIIGVLTAIAAVSLSGTGERAKIKATIASMNQIVHALDSYKLDNNVYPPNLAALQAGKTAYLDANKQIRDGWKQDFLFGVPGANGREFDLYSKGGNGIFENGNGDDLDWWKVKDQ